MTVIYLVFQPRYSGVGQKCECFGYAQNQITENHLNIVDPETFKPLVQGTTMVTTICFGIPYKCELHPGVEIINSKK